ncbi:hypothetical protein ACOZ35_09805 [Halorubrum xinjiangense]|uniref:hypothetical protein n=1 Tax=Halorubrum xinjiangense TaxID=261291 RepID=UPI003C701CA1
MTTGAATAVSTGAFSAAQVTRGADIEIVNDSNALLGLVPNPDVSGVHDDGGELTIELSGDGNGINQGSIYQFGFFVDDSNATAPMSSSGDLSGSGFPFKKDEPSTRNSSDEFGSAFLIANQTDNDQTLEVDYELDPSNDIETGFWFEAHNNGEQKGLLDEEVDSSKKIDLAPGEACGVSFLIYAPPDKDTLGDEITGSLSVTAGEAVSDNGNTSVSQ